MIRIAPALALCALLGACATKPAPSKTAQKLPLTPTQQFTFQTERTPEQLALAPHADGLSDHQRAVLADYARGYIEAGGEHVVVRAPAGGGEASSRMIRGVQAALEADGLRAGEIEVAAYDAETTNAPIVIDYERWRAKPIACGRSWDSLTASKDNKVQSNFGCAETANMAAQIADPRDINGPRASDPADASRRAKVLENYRKGEITAAKSDDKMRGNISQAVQ